MITIPLREYEEMKRTIALLLERVAALEKELALLRNGRKSSTSSTPSSQDIGSSNRKSLREPSNRKSGGQPGHQGSTLEMKAEPDKMEHYIPLFCKSCGEKLEATAELTERRQEIVLPPIEPQYVEHCSYTIKCGHCGDYTTARMPEHLTNNIQYGKNIEALIGYLSVSHYIPYQRITQLLHDCFNLPISEGSIDNILERLREKSGYVYELIKRKIEESTVVGSDETGTHIQGKKGWFHVWQTTLLTYIESSWERSYKSIQKVFEKGLPASILVSDCWAAQLKTPANTHQLCIAHLLRELNNFIDALQCQWSVQMKTLLLHALEIKKEKQPIAYYCPDPKVQLIEKQLDDLLCIPITDKHKKIQAFIKRLMKNRKYLLTFLYHPKVPSDNNGSERAIRNAKVKTKVSGGFRSEQGAERFVVLRSVVDTARKNKQNPFHALVAIANFAAE